MPPSPPQVAWPRAIPRPRLTLRIGARWTVLLLTAPAGYGKTTLAAQVVGRHAQAWCTLTPADADPFPRFASQALHA